MSRISGPNDRARAKTYRETFPERYRDRKLRIAYGISLGDYNAMLDAQNHVCAICGCAEKRKHPTRKQTQRLSVDHDHKTRKVRGLLCRDCNMALGLLTDSTGVLGRAIDYLAAHNFALPASSKALIDQALNPYMIQRTKDA